MNTLAGYTAMRSSKTLPTWLFVLVLLPAAVFVAIRYGHVVLDAPKMPAAVVSAADREDLLRHLDSVLALQLDASNEAGRSQVSMDRLLPLINDPVADRRLEIARAHSVSSERQLRRAYEELQLVRDLLAERRNER